MPGIFGRPSALPFFCEAKGDYYRAALLQKNRAFEEGVLWRGRGSPGRFFNATAFTSNEVVYYRPHMRFVTRADKKESWGFPAPLSELFPVTLRSTDSLREPACCREKGGKNLYNRFLLIIV